MPTDTHAHDDKATSLDGRDLSWARLLLVDDNENNLELLQAYVEELGCDVSIARDGQEALAAVERDRPDLILLDIMMPRMSGFQTCERIKADPAMRGVPIIMVTALNEIGDVGRAIDAGADDFLTKPVDRLDLLTRIRALLAVRRMTCRMEDALARIKGAGGRAV